MSAYDKIHDASIPDETIRKRGVKYERLTAVVSALLNAGPVRHDVRLIGESTVKHQIDVHVGKRRTLIECKDLDESQDKVNLDIVRSFATVVRDLKPDEAWIVTCMGFTRDAAKMAKHEGIKLVVLREFREQDWEGKVKRIIVNLQIKSDFNHNVQFAAGPGPGDLEALNSALQEFGPGGRLYDGKTGMILHQANEPSLDVADWLEQTRPSFDVLQKEPGQYTHSVSLQDARLTVGEHGTHPISAITVSYLVSSTGSEIVIDAGSKIATLLL
jgi:hypothetical protein